MNLALNARDAMPGGGTLVIRARPAAPGELDHRATIEPGQEWTVIEVADDGIGMDEATLARAYDPFFTTKAEGRGTGLGLATVRAIADQAHGVTWIESAPDEGTTVSVAFPREEQAAEAAPADAGAVLGAGGLPAGQFREPGVSQ